MEKRRVRTTGVENLESLHELPGRPPKSLWHFKRTNTPGLVTPAYQTCNLVFPPRVVLKFLRSLLEIDLGGKGIMQPKLSREDVHGNLGRVCFVTLRYVILLRRWELSRLRTKLNMGASVQDVCVWSVATVKERLGKTIRMCL